MIIELPFPDSALMPNRANGKHFAATSSIKKKAHADAYTLMKLKHPHARMVSATPILITYVQKDKRHRDLDNLLAASKHYLDGLAKALSSDDKYFEPVTIRRSYGTEAKMIVELG
jgi:crossover junction endodeoxyribonuclease RusA